MKSIYILLTKSDTLLSRLVHTFTGDTYTHAAISFDDGLRVLYSSSRKNGRTMFPAGPCREFLKGHYYMRRNKLIPCAVYELQVSEEAFEKAKDEVDRIISDAPRYHFNIIGLICCSLNIPYKRKHYYFCSQFVSEILLRSKAIELPKVPCLMKPSDYTKHPDLLCRFKGYIHELTRQNKLSFS